MIRYCWPSDDEQLAGQSKIAFHSEDGDWWAGIQKCAATLALAATLAVSAASTQAQQVFSYHQDDPAGNLSAIPEELSWIPPVSSNLWAAPPRVFTDDEVVVQQPVTFQPDEDFWRNPVPPISSYPVPLVFSCDEVIVAQPSAFQPDEDFWDNTIPPVFATLAWPQPWAFDQSEPGNLFGQYDEDFWDNPVAPVKASFGPLYLPDPEEIPAASLLGVPQESDWSAPPSQPWTPVPKAFLDDDVVFPAAFPPIQDEDFWLNPAAPIAAKNFVALPYLPDADDVPSLFGLPQDDFWIPGPMAIPAVPRVFADDEVVATAPAAPIINEDYWLSQPRPQIATITFAGPIFFDESLPIPTGAPTGPFIGWTGGVRTYPQIAGSCRTFSQLEAGHASTYSQVASSCRTYSQLVASRISACPALSAAVARIICLD